MRLVFLLGRLCSRPAARYTPRPSVRPNFRTYKQQRRFSGYDRLRGTHRQYGSIVLQAAAAPAGIAGSVAAFVAISNKDNTGTDQTSESRMLDASRKELEKKLREDDTGLSRVFHAIVLFLDLYLWEPLCTGFRFLHLAVIFVPVIGSIPALFIGRRHPDRDNERTGSLWWYELLVWSMERAGPAFIKLGQWAASRSDIFPTEMCEIMSKLHSNAPAHTMRHTRQTIKKAFHLNIEDIFEEFQETPLGVGAIGQVYRARLKPGFAAEGDADIQHERDFRQEVRKSVESALKSTPNRVPSTYVAVKVLHPYVERLVRRDLRIMGFVANLINCIPTMEWLSLPAEVDQFGDMMKLQLDLRIEAANLTRFRQFFRDRTTAWFPYPYQGLTTRQVLVEEYAEGIPLGDFIENGGGVFQADIADEGLDAFLHMVLIDNFIHADLHPGNILVRFYKAHTIKVPGMQRSKTHGKKPHAEEQEDVTEKALARLKPLRKSKDHKAWRDELAALDRDGYRPQLIFIDTGLVTELNEVNRHNFLDLFRSVVEFDGYKAGNLMCDRCRSPEAVIDQEVFALKMQRLVSDVKNQTLALGKMKIGDVLQQVLAMVRQHHVRMEGDFVNVVISILLLEGIGRALNPNVDLLSSSLPILRQLGAKGGADMLRQGDFSMVLAWVGLEARQYLQTSIEDVEKCVKYDMLAPNI